MTTFNESQPQSRRAARRSEREDSAEHPEPVGEQPEGAQLYSPSGNDSPAWNESPEAGGTNDVASAIPRGRRAAAPAGPPSGASEPLSYRTQQGPSDPGYDGPSFTGQIPFPPVDGDAFAVASADDGGYRQREFSPEGRRSAPMPTSNWAPVAPNAAAETVDTDSGHIPAEQIQADSAENAEDGAVSADEGAVEGGAPHDGQSEPRSAEATTDFPVDVTPQTQFSLPESALQDTIVPHGDATAPMVEEPAHEGEQAPIATPAVEHTMTRRELRALEAERAKGAQPAPLLPEFAPDGSLTGAAAAVFVETNFNDDVSPASAPVGDIPMADLPIADVPALVDPIRRSDATSTSSFSTLPATAFGSADEIAADDAAAVDEVEFIQPALTPFDSLFQVPPAEPSVAPDVREAPLSSQSPEFEAKVEPIPLVDPLLFSAPVVQADQPSLTGALSEFDSLTRGGGGDGVAVDVNVASNPAALPAESQWMPPIGHWSAQDDVDEDAPGGGSISRTVGSGISTTSALVLPAIPDGADIRGPLTGTGEIMLTGSIDLPRTLSATGQSDRFDGDDVDALFDLSDAEVISTDSSPVRAIRAVSTHTSGHGVTHTQKPKGTRALTGLLIAASSLAVVVAGLLVAAFAFNLF